MFYILVKWYSKYSGDTNNCDINICDMTIQLNNAQHYYIHVHVHVVCNYYII